MLILAALADPTRRRIVEILAEGEYASGAIARRFDMSPRPVPTLAMLRARIWWARGWMLSTEIYGSIRPYSASSSKARRASGILARPGSVRWRAICVAAWKATMRRPESDKRKEAAR